MPDTTEMTKERWVYLGRGLNRAHKLVYRWQDPEGNDLSFSKLRGSVIGGSYEVEVERADTISVIPSAKYLPDVELTENALVLQARDKLAYGDKSRIDAEHRATRNTELSELLAPLQEAAAACKSYDDMEALITVVNRAMRATRRTG